MSSPPEPAISKERRLEMASSNYGPYHQATLAGHVASHLTRMNLNPNGDITTLDISRWLLELECSDPADGDDL